MLRINSITIQNFGPYFGTHVLSLPKEKGVSVLWAYNGVGKTSLMNSLRFAFWGTLADTKHDKADLADFVNDYAKENEEDMSVKLDCDFNGDHYIISRRLKRRPLTDGSRLEDYEVVLSVKKNHTPLNLDEANHFLNNTFPSKISRFYLFDAELLEQYEKLLSSDDEGTGIKQSIENILGLPILENARISLNTIQDALDKTYTRVSRANSSSEKQSELLENFIDLDKQLKKELSNLKAELSKYTDREIEINNTLRQNEQFNKLLNREDVVNANYQSSKELLQSRIKLLTESFDSLWKIMLDQSIDGLLGSKLSEQKQIQSKINQNSTSNAINEIRSLIVEKQENECPTCGHLLTTNDLIRIKELLNSASSSSDQDIIQKYTDLTNSITTLTSYKSNLEIEPISNAILSYLEAYDASKSLELELLQIKEQKNSFHNTVSEEALKSLGKELQDVVIMIATLRKSISTKKNDIEENKIKIDNAKKLINKNANSELKKVLAKQDFINQLSDILSASIDGFRDDLKVRVQSSASKIFVKIAHDEDYVDLSINNNYGLEIIKSDGKKVPNRSSGYEQVVAISLIGALHNNTPITGPIFMDSTFQRIDPLHKAGTLSVLPMLSDQVVILAYPTEFDDTKAREILNNSYLKDYRLSKVKSQGITYTKID